MRNKITISKEIECPIGYVFVKKGHTKQGDMYWKPNHNTNSLILESDIVTNRSGNQEISQFIAVARKIEIPIGYKVADQEHILKKEDKHFHDVLGEFSNIVSVNIGQKIKHTFYDKSFVITPTDNIFAKHGKPLSLTDIRKRYEKKTDKYQSSVLGYLMRGGKGFYLLDDPKSRNLNSYEGGKWVYNEEDSLRIQEYSLTKKGSTKTTGSFEEDYYPWYYRSDILPIAFEIVRLMPFYDMGEKLRYLEESDVIFGSDNKMPYSLSDCFLFPEFFRPIYPKS